MIRRIALSIITAGLVVFTGGVASAAPPVTTTVNEQGLVETFIDVIPSCDFSGAPYQITTTSNLVSHETVFDDGRIHGTFTQTGTFVAVPLDPSEPSYTGKFTVWGGFNANSDSVFNGTFTFNVRGTGSDGSTFKTNLVDHFNVRPDGSVNAFFHCH